MAYSIVSCKSFQEASTALPLLLNDSNLFISIITLAIIFAITLTIILAITLTAQVGALSGDQNRTILQLAETRCSSKSESFAVSLVFRMAS